MADVSWSEKLSAHGGATRSAAGLLEWVDQSKKQSSALNTSCTHHELGLASTLYQTCLHLYAEVWKKLRSERLTSRLMKARICENLGRLLLWGDALDNGRLDRCLDQSSEIRTIVVEILHNIGKSLEKGISRTRLDHQNNTSPKIQEYVSDLSGLLCKAKALLSLEEDEQSSDFESDSSDDESSESSAEHCFVEEMHAHTMCLMDLGPTLENLLKEISLSGRDRIEEDRELVAFHVTDAARQYVLQVHDKYREAELKLVERLGEANWQRYIRIVQQAGGKQGQPEETTTRTFVPISKFHDSGLGSSAPPQTYYTKSIASHTSFLSSNADIEGGRLRVPPTPVEVSKGTPFECSVCGKVLTGIKSRVDWKIHVFRDLQPYICTFSHCRDMLVTFPTRQLWADHEFTQHRHVRSFFCYACAGRFEDEESYTKHLAYQHNLHLQTKQLSARVSAALRVDPVPVETLQCPLCLQGGWISSRKFVSHLGRHMETVALAVLPKEVESDSEDGSALSRSRTPRPSIHLNDSGSITTDTLAKLHLPDILLAHGPLAIRHIMGFLNTSVPGFSSITSAKARRVVVTALESRRTSGEGGGADGQVEFEKVGWGHWDVRIKGQASRDRRTSNLSPLASRSSSPPRSFKLPRDLSVESSKDSGPQAVDALKKTSTSFLKSAAIGRVAAPNTDEALHANSPSISSSSSEISLSQSVPVDTTAVSDAAPTNGMVRIEPDYLSARPNQPLTKNPQSGEELPSYLSGPDVVQRSRKPSSAADLHRNARVQDTHLAEPDSLPITGGRSTYHDERYKVRKHKPWRTIARDRETTVRVDDRDSLSEGDVGDSRRRRRRRILGPNTKRLTV